MGAGEALTTEEAMSDLIPGRATAALTPPSGLTGASPRLCLHELLSSALFCVLEKPAETGRPSMPHGS